MTDEGITMIRAPLLIMFQDDGASPNVICHIHQPKDWTHKHYGLVICDAVRHVAKAFKVDEDDVWKWVEKERYHPTTPISQAS